MNHQILIAKAGAFFCAATLLLQPAHGEQKKASPARITVEVNKPGVTVSPTLYGIFFEEINRAGDGGLYAEMLQNRSFEDAAAQVLWKKDENGNMQAQRLPEFKAALGWSLIKGAGADAKMELDDSKPLNANNPTSLKLQVANAGERAGVANDGFKGCAQVPQGEPDKWLPQFEKAVSESKSGIAVVQGKEYDLSFYARAENFSGSLTVSIEKQDGTALATQEVQGIGADWVKFDCKLIASATEPNARLVLSTKQPGTIWLDMLSLFPKDTFKDRPNGLRADLAQLLADMHPGFVRFPGGCFVEGDKLAEATRWKKTIGDIAQRPGHWNLWGYNSTDGLGYHEYLQLCEDIGAEPLFVINCGMSHEEQRKSGRKISTPINPEFLQDALDAIEYANGPADSEWGSLRAKAGHPGPFHLKFIEIGNENGGPEYNARYYQFHDAIKKKHPAMKILANQWQGIPTERPLDIIDEHYYLSPEAFMGKTKQYDTYKRTGPKIYIGEYAVTRPPRGNLRGAVGEAAFMTGMERNSDIVAMGSYAPLFSNPPWDRWEPNAIVFNSSQSYGIPSWHVQTMFAANRSDTVLPTEVQAQTVEIPSNGAGMIGVGSWETQVEYKDITVTDANGKTLFASDFAKGLEGWRTNGGKWETSDGTLKQTSDEPGARVVIGDKSWKDYTLKLKARKLGGREGFLVLFQLKKDSDKTWWNIGGWGNTLHGLEYPASPENQVPGHVETNRWYDIRIETKGGKVRCYLDDKLVQESTPMTVSSLYAMAGEKKDSGEVILKVVNASTQPQEVAIDLKGAKSVEPKAKAIVLASENGDDENSFEQPSKVAPKEETISNAARSFRHTFSGNSVNILRIKANVNP